MHRRKFIKLAGFSAMGQLIGLQVLASNFLGYTYNIIDILPPQIHVRHGYLNLEHKTCDGLLIQRDVFNKNGLEQVASKRMTSIKISEGNLTTFGVCSEGLLVEPVGSLKTVELKKGRIQTLKLSSPSILFSEYEEFKINELQIGRDKALYYKSNANLKIESKKEQSIFIYTPKNFKK